MRISDWSSDVCSSDLFHREQVGAVRSHYHVIHAPQAGFPALSQQAAAHALARFVMGLADAIVDLVHALADLLQHRVVGVVGVVGVGRAAAWAGCLPIDRRRKRVGEVLPVIRMTGMPRRGGFCRRLSGHWPAWGEDIFRSEEHTSELQSLMRISYAVFCLKKKK